MHMTHPLSSNVNSVGFHSCWHILMTPYLFGCAEKVLSPGVGLKQLWLLCQGQWLLQRVGEGVGGRAAQTDGGLGPLEKVVPPTASLLLGGFRSCCALGSAASATRLYMDWIGSGHEPRLWFLNLYLALCTKPRLLGVVPWRRKKNWAYFFDRRRRYCRIKLVPIRFQSIKHQWVRRI